jgi:RNase H-like domain found in reverse transcriptase/Reverse transcriptase (RNA-dependent DNA polymerase)
MTFLHLCLTAVVSLDTSCDRIEPLTFQGRMDDLDRRMKEKYRSRFPTHLPPTMDGVPTHIYLRIRLKDQRKIVKGRGYVAPKKHHDAWKKLLDEHLATGRLRPSSSEHSSPSFVIPKRTDGVPDHSLPPRWLNDYRELDLNTVPDSFPLSRVDDILADCGKGKIFGKLDMTNSFFQTRVHPDDIHLTAIRTPWGLYERTVMPMGGRNAPSTHQPRMTDALRHLIGKICHVYLDDIIIWSQNLEEHERNVQRVLQALEKAEIYCNLTKTQLCATEVSFLGHRISASGIQTDPRKCERIANWPTPTTSTNVRGFLGLTRYLATFLPVLAEHTSVLTPLTNKECDKDFPPWTQEHQTAFEAIKLLVTSPTCLTVIDYEDKAKRIFLTIDASRRRTGTVLSFGETWETARPVAYDSYQLNAAERNYPTHEQELLAIIKALKNFRHISPRCALRNPYRPQDPRILRDPA